MRKLFKLFKKFFGFAEKVADKVSDLLGKEEINQAVSITGKIIKGIKVGLELTDRNPQVDSKVEQSLIEAALHLDYIESQEVSSAGDLIVVLVNRLKDEPYKYQQGLVFQLAVEAVLKLYPKAKRYHVEAVVGLTISALKKKN
jgi:hypothetical protein